MTDLPLNWCECKLEDFTKITLGQSPSSDTYNTNGDGVPFFQGKADFGQKYPTVRCWCNKPNKIADKGDILLSVRAPVGAVNISQDRCCIGRGLAALHALGNVQSNFIYFMMLAYQDELHRHETGTTFAAITGYNLKNLKINLPSLAEQGRIVKKIEKVFERIDLGTEHLTSAREKIKQYRQSVLSAAFEGKLYCSSKWKTVLLKDVCEINPKTEIPSFTDDQIVSFLPMSSIQEEVNLYQEKKEEYGKIKKGYTKFKNKDVLFAKITPCMENGKCCLVNNLIKGIGFGSTEFHVLRSGKDILPEFLYLYVSQLSFRREAKTRMTGAVGQQRVPTDFIKYHNIPLPPLAEQKRIVEEIEKRFAAADRLEKAVNDGLEKAALLKQSVLKKAFAGELVPQNPADEPASVLLYRIKSAKSESDKSAKSLKSLKSENQKGNRK